MVSGISAAGGTFISDRNERTSLIRSMTQLISSTALPPDFLEGFGQGARQSSVSRLGPSSPSTSHNSSVTNGMNGCSALRISSSAQAAIAWVSALAASSSPKKTGLANSRYQSQNLFQTKR